MMEVMPVASQPIYQFYAELKDYKPLIWRRFQVAGNITLAQLGYVTMTLFEMKGSHLFHLEYSVNENMPDDDPAYQSEPDKILHTKASQTRSCDMILPVATHSLKR